ncbi:pyrimidine dimer DNA glycosylase/endonuclease V [Nitrosomonas communis]|uniref:pyrimidine dimer DNA glycosylase/endonuclease V n=1 Tax=Nitrosomonas communis TaxID=44574 RepID=UPI0026EC4EAF|nr:pyrimidine dimer DNA glycosylase/endonuclease V [Nitrosomonas communis]MCO6427716.1 DNA lyase [Nitrosomonas communis]
MRLWSIHPKYLDAKGLVALWREGLLAQNVLLGKTKGYKNHPQLIRFKITDNPSAAIAYYLKTVTEEADRRNYHFNKTKIIDLVFKDKIPVTNGQVQYEFKHLLHKLKNRDPNLYEKFKNTTEIELHPLFDSVAGDVEDWEII